MTLRVEDLKKGNVVRVDLPVVTADYSDGDACVLLGDRWFSDADLAAVNAELVVRPRPVRKGDEIRTKGHPAMAKFIAYCPWREYQVVVDVGDSTDGFMVEDVTHADGSPISWEASE